jgi:hypothetical protein
MWLRGLLAGMVSLVGPQALPAAMPGTGPLTSSNASASWTGMANGAGQGDVDASVPGESIAMTDGIGKVVHGSSRYRAIFQVWVAPNVRHGTVRVVAVGASIKGCSTKKLQPRVDNYVDCRLQPAGGQPSITVTLTASSSNFGTVSRSFAHAVSR